MRRENSGNVGKKGEWQKKEPVGLPKSEESWHFRSQAGPDGLLAGCFFTPTALHLTAQVREGFGANPGMGNNEITATPTRVGSFKRCDRLATCP